MKDFLLNGREAVHQASEPTTAAHNPDFIINDFKIKKENK